MFGINGYQFGYLDNSNRYLLMHPFRSEIEDFVASHFSGDQAWNRVEEFDAISVSLISINKNILIVFHFLNESPELHSAKVQKYISDEKQLVIHIYEDLWRIHKAKIKSRLASLLGISKRIYGRETRILSIDNNLLLKFLEENHLNVPLKAKYKYGLYQNESLLAVMSFSKGRLIDRNDIKYNSYELLRFCNRLNHTVVGGFTKLLNHFVNEVSPEDIMTYVDKDWSNGESYVKAGFVLEGHLPSIMFYLDPITGQRQYPEKECDIDEKSRIKVFNSGSYKFIKYLK